MNEITIANNNGSLTVSSVQVAENFGKEHKNVTRDIENLIEQSKTHCSKLSGESIRAENSAVTAMFIESTYVNERGRIYKSYEMTRDGFTLLAMGFTGKQALEWKLKYIEAFNLMEQALKSEQKHLNALETQARADRAAAMRINAENRRLKLLFDNPQWKDMQLSGIGIETLGLKKVESATGIDVGNALPQTVKTWSATEIGKALGVSSAAIGRKANALGLKTEQNGIFVLDKSRHSNKEVTSFRYNQHGVEALADAFGVIDYTLN